MADQIHIEQLELYTQIGVTQEERAAPQRLTVNITLEPMGDFRSLADELANTIDYFAVTRAVQSLAADHPRNLIETLAEEIAAFLTARYPIAAVHLELRKYILPDATYVAVRLSRSA